MKKVTNLLVVALLMFTAFTFAQGTISGTVIDGDASTPLPGVNIIVQGTSQGVTTDFDGNFSVSVSKQSGTLSISYVGFTTKQVPFEVSNGESLDLGEIVLEVNAASLDEVIVNSFSLAIDRKTPVAVSTIKAQEIETKLGSQEFPEILKSTPGVYVTKNGGGYGDANLRIRGFSSENVAVLINGVPVNDMENGVVYWSNWAGLADVTRSMQVQRGLGASKIAVPSVGGTVNILTKTTDAEKGGSISMTGGNDGYQKYGATLSTGVMDNGYAVTVSGTKTSGDGYIDGTQFDGFSYFLSIAKDFGQNHKLSFTAFGAGQRHGQRQNRQFIETYRRSERGLRFNQDWGYKNGQIVNIEDNFYHKPQMSLNHYWTINDKMNLSTAVYASFGSGGGGGTGGDTSKFGLESDYRDGDLQPVNLDKIVADNLDNGIEGSETYLRASRNDHKWYGVLSQLSADVTDDIRVIGGLDFRYYKGDHFTELTDLLGGDYYIDNSDENNPNKLARVGDIISYHDEGFVLREGLFAQAEYTKNDFNFFLAGSVSNTGYKRKDYFNYLASDPNRETDYQNFVDFTVKGGANYIIDNNQNVFANIGYLEKAPFDNAVFQNNQNDINPDAVNQKIFSAELGYSYRSSLFSGNLNIYRTEWKDQTNVIGFTNNDGSTGFANLLGINSLHQGIELDFTFRPLEGLTITGFGSLQDNTYTNNLVDVPVYNEDQVQVNTVDVYIKDVKVGNAAQTTAGLGVDYAVLPRTNVRVDYLYGNNFYGDFDPTSREDVTSPQAWEAPSYGLFDVNLRHGFDFGGFDTTLTANVYNLFDTEYIADATDGGSAFNSRVFYGFGRTFTIGAKINF
ncbi:TonB-dependent receptor [Leeuwenhoekiella sp. A16]|uniref:TonB-dependent receptor n=1 Tax=unclassified Leeuwenhoekiella TaxID=2615029 RepID=UPI003A7F7A2B